MLLKVATANTNTRIELPMTTPRTIRIEVPTAHTATRIEPPTTVPHSMSIEIATARTNTRVELSMTTPHSTSIEIATARRSSNPTGLIGLITLITATYHPLHIRHTEGPQTNILRPLLRSYKERSHHLCKVTGAFLPRAQVRSR